MSSAGSLKIASQCWAKGKSWESGTALEIISLLSVSCGFFFSPKTELFENKGFKISRQRRVCGLPLFQQSPWLVVLQCQKSWSLNWKDPVFSWLSGPKAMKSSYKCKDLRERRTIPLSNTVLQKEKSVGSKSQKNSKQSVKELRQREQKMMPGG